MKKYNQHTVTRQVVLYCIHLLLTLCLRVIKQTQMIVFSVIYDEVLKTVYGIQNKIIPELKEINQERK